MKLTGASSESGKGPEHRFGRARVQRFQIPAPRRGVREPGDQLVAPHPCIVVVGVVEEQVPHLEGVLRVRF